MDDQDRRKSYFLTSFSDEKLNGEQGAAVETFPLHPIRWVSNSEPWQPGFAKADEKGRGVDVSAVQSV